MSEWKKLRKKAHRYARRVERQTAPGRRQLSGEARRRAPSFAAFAIATALELLRQREAPARRSGGFVRFFRTILLLSVAAFIAALFLKPKR